ncbi:MAG: FMN-binding protein [Phycisphaerae bacterium]|jgi:uncharacterized protein with FMN-binding domain|nr:FMN-binding protein [Phycisphaerae bacterium]
MKHVSFSIAVLILIASLGVGADRAAKTRPARPSLSKALAALKIPPPWFAETKIQWKTSEPWKKARLEIRRLLGLGTEDGHRQAVKLTYLYLKKNDIGNGHEWPMYLFLGGQTAWATRAFEQFLGKNPERNTHAYINLMSCYRTFGEYAKAKATARTALKNLPVDQWRIANQAAVYDALGDLYAELGDTVMARKNYSQAAALYPKSKQPYGRHLLVRRAKKIRGKIDLLDIDTIKPGKLRDGKYPGDSIGYTGPLRVTVTVRDRRIADIAVRHTEKIHQNCITIIPQRIVKAQSLKVDAVTGATVTSQAIAGAALDALRKAGRK